MIQPVRSTIRRVLHTQRTQLVQRIHYAQARLNRFIPSRAGGRFRANEISHEVLTRHHTNDVIAFYMLQATEEHIRSYSAALHDSTRFCIGIFLRGQLVAAGWVSPQWKHIDIPGHWFGAARVDPNLRRRGLGQQLHHARLAEAARRNIGLVYVNVRADNEVALGALHAVGFMQIAKPDWELLLHQQLGMEQIILVSSTGYDMDK